MDYSASYATADRDQTRTLFSHVMWLVALAAGCFALGCYAGRDLSMGWSIAWFIVGFGCLIALNFTRQSSGGASIALLLLMGLFLGLGMGPVVAYYTTTSPQARLAGGRGDGPVHRRASARTATRPGATCPPSAGSRSSP